MYQRRKEFLNEKNVQNKAVTDIKKQEVGSNAAEGHVQIPFFSWQKEGFFIL